MSTAVNTRAAERFFAEVWNQRNEAALEELMAVDVCGWTEGGHVIGRDAWVNNAYRVFLGAFPDLHLELLGTVAEGEEVMIRWRARGTHGGDTLGLTASGLSVDFRGMTWFKMRNGMIVEGLDSWNQSALLEALQTRQSVGSCLVGSVDPAAGSQASG